MHPHSRGRWRTRRLPRGPEPDPAGDNEIIWGVHLLRGAGGRVDEVRGAGIQKGMAAAPSTFAATSSAAERPRPTPTRCSPITVRKLADARNESKSHARRSAPVRRRAPCRSAIAGRGRDRRDAARAAADVEAAKLSAIADLRAEVASLAIGAAETIVQKNLDRETQMQLVENYINQVGAGRMAETTVSRHVYADAPLRASPRPRVASTKSKTSCSGSPGSSRAPTSCATR